MKDLFFKDWQSVYHVAICSLVAYLALFVFIRLSGKRTLSKLNAFDFVVSVTLGSTLSSMILAKVPIVNGMVAVVIIIGLQFVLAKLARESDTMEKVINSKPTLLFYNGEFLEKEMSREVITREEIFSAIREFRIEKISDVRAVVMELNGELTVVKKAEGGLDTSLGDIEIH